MLKKSLKEIEFIGTLRKLLRPIKKKYTYVEKEILFLHRFISVYGFKRLIIKPTLAESVRQKILTFNSNLKFNDLEDLKDYLNSKKIEFNEGKFSLYLGPVEKDKILPNLSIYYPPQAGIKILKKSGEPSRIKYANKQLLPNASKVALAHLPYPIEQATLINYMAELKFFPYCYDVIRLKINEKCVHTGFVVEHVDGDSPTKDECQTFIQNLEIEINKKDIGLTLPDWKNHMDFKCPNANSNLLKYKHRAELRYVDFQNFFFVDKNALLQRKIKESKKDTHFGETKLILGGKHLYQSVPGISKISKRNTDERFSIFVAMLKENKIFLEDRLVLDIGCNIGMILAKCLSEGAWWGIGFDKPNVIKHARILLNLIGCSRVELFSVELDKKTRLYEYIPRWIDDSKIKNSIVFYLAVRKHFGFLPDLTSMPWKAMVYEGYQNETVEETIEILENFASKSKANLKLCRIYKDATTTPRPLALLIRE